MTTLLVFYARIGGSRLEVLEFSHNTGYERVTERRYLITGGRRKLQDGCLYTSQFSADAMIQRALAKAREWYPKARLIVTVCNVCRQETYVRRGYIDQGPGNPAAGHHCRHIRPHVAWTGGGEPRPWRTLTTMGPAELAEREYALSLYREQIEAFRRQWCDMPNRDTLGIFWGRARFDAFATYRR